jgi:uncharacterized repeat protein (TIGR02543 family)
MKAGMFFVWMLWAAAAFTGCHVVIMSDTNSDYDTGANAPNNDSNNGVLTFTGAESGTQYEVKLFPYSSSAEKSAEAWREATINPSASGTATASSGAAAITLKTPSGAAFNSTGTYLVLVSKPSGGESRYKAAVFRSGNAAFDLATTLPLPGTTASSSISLKRSGEYDFPYDFPSVTEGYSESDRQPLKVTVTNTSSVRTGILTISLSGADDSAFEVIDAENTVITSLDNIDPGKSAFFAVRPKLGLTANEYIETVTVSGAASGNNNPIAPQSFTVSFTVEDAAETETEETPDEDDAAEPDDAVEADDAAEGSAIVLVYEDTIIKETDAPLLKKTEGPVYSPEAYSFPVTIKNTGSVETDDLTVALSEGKDSSSEGKASSFTVSSDTDSGSSIPIPSIPAGRDTSFTVTPNRGLSAGTYTATVTVSGKHGIFESFTVSFTVVKEDEVKEDEAKEDEVKEDEVKEDEVKEDEVKECTVTFYLDDESGEIHDTKTVPHNTAVTEPAVPTRWTDDLFFDGWFTASGGTEYDFSSPVPGDLQLYAHWTGEIKTVDIAAAYLDFKDENTADDPILLKMSLPLADSVNNWSALVSALEDANKYVDIDLSKCSTPGEFDAGTGAGKAYVVSLILPDGATSIKANTNAHWTELKTVSGIRIRDIGASAFSGCTALTTATFHEVTNIEASAFSGCTALTELYIPDITHISTECFSYTGTATPLTITMGDTNPEVEGSLFAGVEGDDPKDHKNVTIKVPYANSGDWEDAGYDDTWKTAFMGANTYINLKVEPDTAG